MKVLTTTGLTKLIELSKDTFLDKNNTVDIASALSDVAVSGSYDDLSDQPYFNGIKLDNTTSTGCYGVSTTAAATVQKEVSIPSITKLEAGQVIIVQPTITSTVANSTLKLNDFDAYPMRYNNAAITTSTDSVVWGATFPSTWLFDGEYWVFLGHGLDSNSTYTVNYSIDAGQYTAGAGSYPITRYSLIAQKADGTWEKITKTNASYSTSTTKAVNPNGFRLGQIRYHSAKTEITTAGALVATNTIYNKAATIDMRYSTNCGGTTTWALGDYIYLVGTMGSDGLFYLDTTTWWSNALPATNDGKLYIRLGIALAAASYTMSFFEDRPIFYHDGTKICEYMQADNKQDKLVSGTNIKTINNNSILGSGNLSLSTLPSQSGQSGKYLTTNGTTASWANVPTEIPTQTGNSGKYLTTNGTSVSWATVDALPSQTSQSGKYLTTNGTTASWANIPTEIPSQSGQSGKYLTTDGSAVSWATVDALPSQASQSGKFLTTNGTTASWTSISQLPSQSGNSGKYLTTNGSVASWVSLTIPTTTDSVTSGSTAALTSGGAYTNLVTKVEAGDTANKIKVTKAGSASTITINNVANATTASKLGSTTVGGTTTPIYLNNGTATALSYTIAKSVPSDAVFTDTTYTNGAGISLSGTTFSANCDTTTVSTNSSNKLQSIGVIDKQSSSAVYTWKGTLAQYNALATKNNNWIYYITDDTTLPTDSYYTKAQIDAMVKLNHTIEQDTASVILKDTNTSADITTAPSSAHNGGLVQFKDKNGETSGYVYTRYETNGDIIQYLQSNKKVNGTVYESKIGTGVKNNGTIYTYAPKPAASLSNVDTNIATVGWVNDPGISTNVVHKSGNETITGNKTFSGNNRFTGIDTFTDSTQFTGTPEFVCGNTTVVPMVVKNSLDDSTEYTEEQLETSIGVVDTNGVWLGGWEHYHKTDGTYTKQMTVKRQGAEEYAGISVSIDVDGNSWCNLPADTYGTTFHGLSSRSMWADLAERYQSDKEYPIGTLIKFGGSKDITIADNRCNGVISDKPGYILDSELKDSQPIALVGKTPIRIIGAVDKFDRIVLDPEHPGVGRVKKAGEDLPTIARALEEVDDPNEKLVLCVTKFNLD